MEGEAIVQGNAAGNGEAIVKERHWRGRKDDGTGGSLKRKKSNGTVDT